MLANDKTIVIGSIIQPGIGLYCYDNAILENDIGSLTYYCQLDVLKNTGKVKNNKNNNW